MGGARPAAADASDAPDAQAARPTVFVDATSYDQALQRWRTAEDVNAWIGAKFEYDAARSMALSETQRTRGQSPPIHSPAQFFGQPKGVCVDLARFGVETLQRVAPELTPRFLMIEFDPTTIRGNVLRRHWVAAYQRDGSLYFFADSKRPGHIAGPYPSVQAYIDEYAAYRGRAIVASRELATFQRSIRVPLSKQPRADG